MSRKSITAFLVVLMLCIGGIHPSFAVSSIDVNNKGIDDLKNLIPDNNDEMQGVDSDQQSMDNSQQSLNNDLQSLNLQYRTTYKQIANLEKSIEEINLNQALYTNKRDNQIVVEKYMLQVNYYKTFLLIKQLDLLNSQLSVLNLQIVVEQTKLAQGKSTALNVRVLTNQKALLVNTISEISDNIDLSKNNLKATLNMDFEDAFAPVFTIPAVSTTAIGYTLSNLRDACIARNVDVLTLDNKIKAQLNYIQKIKLVFVDSESEVTGAKSDLAKMQLNETTLKKALTIYVKQAFSQYNQTVPKVITANERNAILKDQLLVIETNHRVGDTSDLEFEQQKYEVSKQLFEINSLLVDYLNVKTLVELIDKGIYIKQ